MKGSYLLGSGHWKEVKKLRERACGHICEHCRERSSGLIGHHVVPREAIRRFAALADSLLGDGASRGFKDILVTFDTCRVRCRYCEKNLHRYHPCHGNEEDDYKVMIAHLEEAFGVLLRLLDERSRESLAPEVFFARIVPLPSAIAGLEKTAGD